MHFHQVLVTAGAGDAITNLAFELDALLSNFGTSTIHALHCDPRIEDRVLPLEALSRKQSVDPSDDVLILHASIGEPRVTNMVAQRPEKLIVSYHNISPPEPFLPFDPAFAGLLASGRIELESLASRALLSITESQYNANELIDMGFRNVHVVPLPIDTTELLATESHEPTENHFAKVINGPVILFVGQLLPHKRVDLLLKAYNALVTNILPDANLFMVGTPRLPSYRANLDGFVRELNLPKASFLGSVTQSELVTFYRHADLFVTMSEHEGYCVPLIEGMGFEVPIVARDRGAIAETLAGAGVVLPAEDDPLLAAEAMHEVLTNEPLRRALIARGRERLRTLDPDIARAAMLDHILRVAER